MQKQEKKRAAYLVLLLSYTVFIAVLWAKASLLGWNREMLVRQLACLIACWFLHINGQAPESFRRVFYIFATMSAYVSYGIHETSLFDLAPVMIGVMTIYYAAEMYAALRVCVAVYSMTLLYDLLFLMDGSLEASVLNVSRLMLHCGLVYLSCYLLSIARGRHRQEEAAMQKQMDELEETAHRMGDLIANVSHELRTPINAVTGLTQIMLQKEHDADRRKDILAVRKAGQKLFDQIEDILDYMEIDTGRLQTGSENYQPSSLVNDMKTAYQAEGLPDGLELIFDVDADVPAALTGDEKKIKKIIRHLTDNAIKFTQKGGVAVRIRALRKPYGVNLCIQVSDTGIGIGDEQMEKITEKFYQSSQGRNRRAGGLGLGLPIVYGMVTAMEGFVKIESTPGQGTSVSVSLPQKVLDATPGMSLEQKDALCLACYLKPEKYEVPAVRNYYNELITHIVYGQDVPVHRVFCHEDLERLTASYHLSHLFIGSAEYEEDPDFYERIDPGTEVILAAGERFSLPAGSRVRLLRKPVTSYAIVSMLKPRDLQDAEPKRLGRMLCPGVKTLVVDDEPMNLMVAEGIFRSYQMEVTTAQSGAEAVALCGQEEFDLIFLDHMMPEMDGVETLRHLQKTLAGSGKIPSVIAFTANAVSGAREMFLQEGFEEFVSKPIEDLELERVLRKVLPQSMIRYAQEAEPDARQQDADAMTSRQQDADMTASRQQEAADQKASHREIPDRAFLLPAAEPEKSAQPAEPSHQEAPDQASPLSAARPAQSEKPAQPAEPSHREVPEQASPLSRLGLDTGAGLGYCRGDRAFYRDILRKYAGDAAEKQAALDDCLKREDWEQYRITVHALKSTSRLIGAGALSEQAKAAEEAAKNQDAAYLRANHDGLMQVYRETAAGILEILGGTQPETPAGADAPAGQDAPSSAPITREAFAAKLTGLRGVLDTFEADRALALVRELEPAVYEGTPVKTLLADIAEAIDAFELGAALEKTEALLARLGEDEGQ